MAAVLELFRPPFMFPHRRIIGDENGHMQSLPQLNYRRLFHLVDSEWPDEDAVIHVIEVPAFRALMSAVDTRDDLLFELTEVYISQTVSLCIFVRFLLPKHPCGHPIISGPFQVANRKAGDGEQPSWRDNRRYCTVALEELEDTLLREEDEVRRETIATVHACSL